MGTQDWFGDLESLLVVSGSWFGTPGQFWDTELVLVLRRDGFGDMRAV